mgnify:CR=1 FL=1
MKTKTERKEAESMRAVIGRIINILAREKMITYEEKFCAEELLRKEAFNFGERIAKRAG